MFFVVALLGVAIFAVSYLPVIFVWVMELNA